MISDKKIIKWYPILIILMMSAGIVRNLQVGKLYEMYSYLVYFFLALMSLIYFFRHFKQIKRSYPWLTFAYNIIIVYVIIGFFYQFFIEPSPLYPWERFSIVCGCLFFGSIFIFMTEQVIVNVFHYYWRWLLLIFIGSFLTASNELIQPMYFVIFGLCFHRFLPNNRKIASYIILLFVLLFSMYQRIDFIVVLVPFVIVLLYNTIKILNLKRLKMVYCLLFLVPVFFFYLAYSGRFNVLDMESYMGEIHDTKAGDMTVDTRTFLYTESAASAIKNNYVLWGRTPYYGYDSDFVAYNSDGRQVQRFSEVGIVNQFTMYGLIGVVMFLFFYFFEGQKGLNAKNAFIKCLAVWLCLFWVQSWISNIYYFPNPYYAVMYMVVGLINNRKLREMNETEITNYMKRLMRA